MFKVFMNKQKSKNQNRLQFVIVSILTLLMIGSTASSQIVRADDFQEKINALNQENVLKKQAQAQLGAEASSLSDAINKLAGQISTLEGQIRANQAKYDDIQKQITAAVAELAHQKKLLGENIKAMYLEGQISTLEILASSKDLSEFVDKQQYHDSVRSKIKTTLDKITALKQELKTQKETLEKLIADQQSIRHQLASQRAEQNHLLGLNKEQQSTLDSQIKQNSAQISELRRQQLIANARFSGGTPGSGPACGGGYPGKWCEIAQDSVVDTWGMYNRECVSYTAFRVAASGRRMPYWGGVGNANQWDENARAEGIPVDGNPREGDVAQSNAGPYGHVMYVEYVYGDGTILISQYNASLDGRYSEKRISASGLNFIHF